MSYVSLVVHKDFNDKFKGKIVCKNDLAVQALTCQIISDVRSRTPFALFCSLT